MNNQKALIVTHYANLNILNDYLRDGWKVIMMSSTNETTLVIIQKNV